ncbi:MAG: polynucleotide adenylyltransferase PcnB [Pseudomonadota bacterium]
MISSSETQPSVIEFPSERRDYSRAEHGISRKQISEGALKVLYRLSNAGFGAYLVGGSVRDLLIGQRPKDFDIATDAHPEQVRELFRRSRLIGRRFRLAHVRMGPEVIEVATFRAPPDATENDNDTSPDGRILRDNVYGTLEDDVWRRDFTINSLYYNIADFSVIDYAGGVKDIERKIIRLIGDPQVRLREDPVRMLRAARFAAKLDFEIEPGLHDAVKSMGNLLDDISPARLFDEVLKMFQGGCAAPTFECLERFDLFSCLFPATDQAMRFAEGGAYRHLIAQALINTDGRLREGKSITPGFLFAALLWPALDSERDRLKALEIPDAEATQLAIDTVISQQVAQTAIPRRFSQMTRDIWSLQHRLLRPAPRRVQRTFEHPRFRAAYDFLLLRASVDKELEEQAQWWTEFQEQHDDSRGQMIDRLKPTKRRRRRRRRRSGDQEHGG